MPNYWEPNLNQGNHATKEDLIIANLLSYIAEEGYQKNKYWYQASGITLYAKFNLDTMLPEILEYRKGEK